MAADLVERVVQLGYPCPLSYRSGEEALGVVAEESPGLLVMDIELAGTLDGIATVHHFRQAWPSCPVVFITSHTDEKTTRLARRLMPEAIIGKPFCSPRLKRTIFRILGPPLHSAS